MRPKKEIESAAAADPDARPMTPEELRTARRVPRVKTLRRALGLTQQEFAARYQIPLGTLRDWEQGRTEPDQPVRSYGARVTMTIYLKPVRRGYAEREGGPGAVWNRTLIVPI